MSHPRPPPPPPPPADRPAAESKGLPPQQPGGKGKAPPPGAKAPPPPPPPPHHKAPPGSSSTPASAHAVGVPPAAKRPPPPPPSSSTSAGQRERCAEGAQAPGAQRTRAASVCVPPPPPPPPAHRARSSTLGPTPAAIVEGHTDAPPPATGTEAEGEPSPVPHREANGANRVCTPSGTLPPARSKERKRAEAAEGQLAKAAVAIPDIAAVAHPPPDGPAPADEDAHVTLLTSAAASGQRLRTLAPQAAKAYPFSAEDHTVQAIFEVRGVNYALYEGLHETDPRRRRQLDNALHEAVWSALSAEGVAPPDVWVWAEPGTASALLLQYDRGAAMPPRLVDADWGMRVRVAVRCTNNAHAAASIASQLRSYAASGQAFVGALRLLQSWTGRILERAEVALLDSDQEDDESQLRIAQRQQPPLALHDRVQQDPAAVAPSAVRGTTVVGRRRDRLITQPPEKPLYTTASRNNELTVGNPVAGVSRVFYAESAAPAEKQSRYQYAASDSALDWKGDQYPSNGGGGGGGSGRHYAAEPERVRRDAPVSSRAWGRSLHRDPSSDRRNLERSISVSDGEYGYSYDDFSNRSPSRGRGRPDWHRSSPWRTGGLPDRNRDGGGGHRRHRDEQRYHYRQRSYDYDYPPPSSSRSHRQYDPRPRQASSRSIPPAEDYDYNYYSADSDQNGYYSDNYEHSNYSAGSGYDSRGASPAHYEQHRHYNSSNAPPPPHGVVEERGRRREVQRARRGPEHSAERAAASTPLHAAHREPLTIDRTHPRVRHHHQYARRQSPTSERWTSATPTHRTIIVNSQEGSASRTSQPPSLTISPPRLHQQPPEQQQKQQQQRLLYVTSASPDTGTLDPNYRSAYHSSSPIRQFVSAREGHDTAFQVSGLPAPRAVGVTGRRSHHRGVHVVGAPSASRERSWQSSPTRAAPPLTTNPRSVDYEEYEVVGVEKEQGSPLNQLRQRQTVLLRVAEVRDDGEDWNRASRSREYF